MKVRFLDHTIYIGEKRNKTTTEYIKQLIEVIELVIEIKQEFSVSWSSFY